MLLLFLFLLCWDLFFELELIVDWLLYVVLFLVFVVRFCDKGIERLLRIDGDWVFLFCELFFEVDFCGEDE